MNESDRLDELLLDWQELREQGQEVTPAELCRDCPELLPALQERARALVSMQGFLESQGRGEETISLQPQGGTAPVLAGAGRRLGDYELIQEVARGGMGVVYRARQVSLNRIVALKMIRSGELAGEADVRRFRVEAEAAAKLDHPAIVPIYEVGEVAGQHFYSMGFVEGRSLSARINEGPLPPRQAVELLRLVADAMQYAHQQGVIHRDLKPANILVSVVSGQSSVGSRSTVRATNDGQLTTNLSPKITDFGLAKQTQVESDLTSSGQILGTPSYMPPEQARGETDIGPAADIYSLGAVLYAMLTGRPPFQAANAIETVRQVIDVEPVPPRRLNPGLDRDVETICLKCLQKSPARRYGSAAELAEDLQRYLRGEPISARPVGGLERTWRWCRRKPAIAAALAASALGVLALVAVVLIAAQSENRRLRIQTAESLAAAEKKTADTQRYYALLNGARQRSIDRKSGWALAGIDEVRRAAALDVEVADLHELRSEAAGFLTGVDLRKVATLPVEGYTVHLVAFHPSGKQIAVSGHKHWVAQRVKVYGVPSGDLVHELSVQPNLSTLAWRAQHQLQDGIVNLEFSPDGNTLAIVTRSGWLHRWDLRKNPPALASLKLPLELTVTSAYLDLAHERVFFNEDRHRVKVWSYTSQAAPEVVFDVGAAWWIDIGPGGSRIAVGGNLNILDGASFQQIHRVAQQSGLGRFSRDGRMLVHAMKDHLQLVDVERGEPVRTLQDPAGGGSHVGAVNWIDFSPDSTLLVSGGTDQNLKLWDVTSGALLLTLFIHGSNQVYPMFSPDGRYLATTGDGTAELFEVHGANLLHRAAGRSTQIDTFDLAQGVPLLLTGSRESIAAWDARTGALLESSPWGGPGSVVCLAAAEDGSRVGVCNRPANEFTIHVAPKLPATPVTVNDSAGRLGHCDHGSVQAPSLLQFARGGQAVWCVTGDDTIVQYSLPELAEQWRWSNADLGTLLGRGGFLSLAVGREQALGGTSSGQIIHFIPGSKDGPRMRRAPAGVTSVALSADETQSFIGTANGDVFRLLLPEGTQLEKLGSHSDAVTSVVLIEREGLLATSSRDKTIQLWRQRKDAFVKVLSLRAAGPIDRLRATADGSRLIAHIQGEPALRVWRLDLLRQRLRELNLDW